MAENETTSSVAENMTIETQESVISATEHKDVDLDTLIAEHLEEKFKEIKEVTTFHQDILNGDDLSEMPSIDYIRMYRFYESAVNNLSSKDASLKSTIFAKLYNEIGAFSEFYNSLVKKFEHNSENSANIFLKNTPELKILLEKAKESDNSPEVKEKFIAATKAKFIDTYDAVLENNLELLKSIINVKFFYFDKVLWSGVNKSNTLKAYFEEISLKGEMNLKRYLKLYLKNVDFSKFNTSDWHKYLKQCMEKL
jgi:hypothetical protein